MIFAIREGFGAVRRTWGLIVLLLCVNVSLAALLAVPMAQTLERDLRHKDAAAGMMYGFDYAWWSQWVEGQSGWKSSFGPAIFGNGFAFHNVELLLKGQLPAGLFASRRREGEAADAGAEPEIDGVILGLGVLYMLVQTFLTGGILGALRTPQGGWTLRGVLHGSGFYFGRLVRVAMIALVLDGALFLINAPFARWADRRALEAVTETAAMVWALGRHALLLLAVLFVHMLSSYAKVIVVVEERSSAVLAFLSSASFAFSNLWRAWGHYLAVAGLGLVLLALWKGADALWEPIGYSTQSLTFLLLELMVAGRIALRLALFGGQIALYRRGASLP
jgi:hypothetical protein